MIKEGLYSSSTVAAWRQGTLLILWEIRCHNVIVTCAWAVEAGSTCA